MKNKNKYNFAARATLLALTATAAFALNTTATAQSPPGGYGDGTLWYNGDFNNVNGLANERNTVVTQAAVYDDFNVTGPGWNVTAVFSHNLENTTVTAADWEIRTGVSEGNAGTLVASGTTNSPIVTLTWCHFGFCEYQVEVTSLNVHLNPGTYWLNVTPVGNGSGRSFNSTTSGAHCVGTPCGNDQNAFFNSTFFGTNFTSTANEGQPYDYSMGVIGAVVPEPSPWAMMAMGAVVLIGVWQLRRRNFAARAALLALALTAAFALNTPAHAQAPPGSLWYNGDWNLVNGLANERNTLVTQAAVYDDFNVTAPLGWNVTGLFSDNLFGQGTTTVAGADWEIRSGVSEGNAGTLVASGTTQTPVVTLTGREVGDILEYQVEVNGLNVFLPMLPSGQHYWLNVTPVGNGTGRYFNSTTSGANCVGTPCGNDQNAFFNSTFFGTNFTSTSNEGQPDDYSMGVIGAVVPEPPPWAMMAMGAAVLIGVWQLRRRNFAARAALLALALSAAFALNTTAIAQPPPGTLWYNGDFNNVNALANERNTIVTQAAVYDDFNVTAPLWDVTAVFSDNLASTVITAADWEIRTGVSEGNAGTLIASGTTNTPTVTPTGRSGFGFTEYMVEVTGLNVFLPMLPSGQHYWLNVTPVGNGTGRSFNTTTSGVNCVGTPCGNDMNAFFNSNFVAFFTPLPYDFSDGVIGNVVPEPTTWAIMALGAVVLIGVQRLLRRKKA